MIVTDEDLDSYLRRVLIQVARRLDVPGAETLDENTELLPAMERIDPTVVRLLGVFRSTYSRWYHVRQELARAAAEGRDRTAILEELNDLMRDRDITRATLARHLDLRYPRSEPRLVG
jgi:hypothetical protein